MRPERWLVRRGKEGTALIFSGYRVVREGVLVRRFVRPSLRWGFILSVCLSKRFCATDKGFVRGENGGGGGSRRAVLGVSGVLRTTREVADAAVQRARRFFFRDTG